jgi:hypothetical protein
MIDGCKLCSLFALLFASVALHPAKAAEMKEPAPPGIAYDGEARTGTDTRPVRFRFLCTSNEGSGVTGVLSVELEIPRYRQLQAIFDFDAFEGPGADAASKTLLRGTGARSKSSGRFNAAGSAIENGATDYFALDVAASRREPAALRKLAAVLRPLMDGAGALVWNQENAKPKGTPLAASLDLARSQAEELKTVLAPCLTSHQENGR